MLGGSFRPARMIRPPRGKEPGGAQGRPSPRYSHSSIECFRTCPRQFFYRYVEKVKLPDVPEHIATFFGSRCHEALEWLYGGVMNGVVPEREALLAEFGSIWEREWTEDVVITEADMSGDLYRSLGERCVGNYYDAHVPFNDGLTIALEQVVTFDLDPDDDISMVGYIDRVSKSPDGTWHIHDYKTNKRLPTQSQVDGNPQLAYYEIGIREMWPSVERVELHWHFLRFGETITSIRAAEQLSEVKAAALVTVRDALARGDDENAFEPIESGLCNYCEYRSICPVRKHELRVNGLPFNEYVGEQGVTLVNRWAELRAAKDDLSAKVDAIDKEIGDVQAALGEYADREACTVVVGDAFEATVGDVEKVLFPRKSVEPDEYAELLRTLASSAHWNDVSGLDASRLRALWASGDAIDPGLREILAKFVKIDEQRRFGLRKRRSR
jgi:putative RecB family exonuclease